jgi:hypothetical protein
MQASPNDHAAHPSSQCEGARKIIMARQSRAEGPPTGSADGGHLADQVGSFDPKIASEVHNVW